MRTRTYGGVGGREGNNPAYPISQPEDSRKVPSMAAVPYPGDAFLA